MSFHVLVHDNVHQKAIDILEASDGIRVTAPGKLERAALLKAVGSAQALIIRSGVVADAELISKAPQLKAIARAGVGVDNVDLTAATARGIVVMNTPGGNTISTAEHTFGLMIALSRHMAPGHQSLAEGRWERKAFSGVELKGKTLGIIGLGRIGQAIATRAQAFEMTVIAHDPYLPPAVAEAINVPLLELDDVFAQSDYLTLHAMVTEETRGMVNADAIAQMKDGVRIINAARGALINSVDLAAALQSGKAAGAALDVYETEPPPADHPLIGLPKVLHTPHLAASTSDAQATVAVEAAQLIVDYLLEGKAANVCNPKAMRTSPIFARSCGRSSGSLGLAFQPPQPLWASLSSYWAKTPVNPRRAFSPRPLKIEHRPTPFVAIERQIERLPITQQSLADFSHCALLSCV
jgi:D-3-phosphoglycerate dehydrogenase